VGPWLLLERRGLGTYGAVYRALGAESPSGPVALKLALHPGDPRFSREGELLSRIHHPCVPRLVDQGVWLHPNGLDFPFLAMEWVDGLSLYDWALQHPPTSRQVLQVLARIARALEATHAARGVHRDVKGDNILVRQADGRVFLTDFGAGHYVGAASLTPPPFPPSTPHYRSPEAWRSVRLPMPQPVLPYAPGPADDVFALGVTAFRLVTGEYPFPRAPAPNTELMEGATPPSTRAFNARCCEELSDLTSRMLSNSPEARSSAGELAEALERAARGAGPEAEVPLFVREAQRPMEVKSAPPPSLPQAAGNSMGPWFVAASLGGALALGAGWMLSAPPGEESERRQASAPEETRDGGTVAVGDAVLTAPVSPAQAPSALSAITLEIPPKPLPGQRRADANGRCPLKGQVSIHGGCWIKLPVEPKDCEEEGFIYKGGCYVPVLARARPHTSSPTKRTDDPP
jgi:serine/threonine-protein kinase